MLHRELSEGTKIRGHPRLPCKDMWKLDMKESGIDPGQWEILAIDHKKQHPCLHQFITVHDRIWIPQLEDFQAHRKQATPKQDSYICNNFQDHVNLGLDYSVTGDIASHLHHCLQFPLCVSGERMPTHFHISFRVYACPRQFSFLKWLGFFYELFFSFYFYVYSSLLR